MIDYTIENLKRQKEIAEKFLASHKNHRIEILKPDWPLAKEYGEDIRQNHLDSCDRSIKHYEQRVQDLSKIISDMS